MKFGITKKFMVLVGITGAILLSVFIFALFMLAYLSPTKSFVVPVDVFGEAGIERIVFSIFIAIIVWSLLVARRSVIEGKPISDASAF